jgi:glycosyltransferase involved in cell wall biosynthesis
MPSALMLQPSFDPRRGGGNGVASWMLEALKRDYELTVLCFERPDLARINRFFGTALAPDDFRVELMPRLPAALIRALPMSLDMLRNAWLCRRAARLAPAYDVTFTAHNEIDIGIPAIQYVHYPRFLFPRPAVDYSWYTRSATLCELYYAFTWRLGRFRREGFRINLTLVNSHYIKGLADRAHRIDSTVLHPPACGRFADMPWEARRDAMVCIGRLAGDKLLHNNIEVVRRLRERGFALELDIVGTNDDPAYYARVLRAARPHPWVRLHENLSRTELERLVSATRYGLHGKQGEHVGMAVAEMQQAGCLVFAPRAGGCAEILEHEALVYTDVDEAVEKIAAVLTSPLRQQELLAHQRERKGMFSSDRFCARFREIVSEFASHRSRAG